MMTQQHIEKLNSEVQKLHHRQELAGQVGPDWFEPGMMEYLDQSDGFFDPETGSLLLRFEARGTRYDGRTEVIEKVHVGDPIRIIRDAENPYNPNNFTMETEKGKNIGHMPAELCNALAPFYDEGRLTVDSAVVSYVEPISRRSRHAKQAVLFVKLCGRILSVTAVQSMPNPETAEFRELPSTEQQKPIAYTGDEKHLFVSYSHHDADVVYPLIREMTEKGFRIWYDEGIEPGTGWDDNIADQIEHCDLVIAMISHKYLESENCRDELNYARDEGKKIILVYIEKAELPAGMKLRYNRLYALHRHELRQDDFYRKLLSVSGIDAFRAVT